MFQSAPPVCTGGDGGPGVGLSRKGFVAYLREPVTFCWAVLQPDVKEPSEIVADAGLAHRREPPAVWSALGVRGGPIIG